MDFLTKHAENIIQMDASIVILANHYKSSGYPVNSFLFSYSRSDAYSRARMIEHLFSLGLTNLGVDRSDLDWT